MPTFDAGNSEPNEMEQRDNVWSSANSLFTWRADGIKEHYWGPSTRTTNYKFAQTVKMINEVEIPTLKQKLLLLQTRLNYLP